ncbi:hypothetical protein M9458_015502, partial [Cirrhinus mrigala]
DWREKLQIHPNQHHNLNLTRALAHPNQQILNQTHHQNHILTQNPAGFSSKYKDSECMPNQQYWLHGSYPESTDCAQSTSLTTPHWTSADLGLAAQCRHRRPVL